MRLIPVLAALAMIAGGSSAALAQSKPTSNATVLGTETAPSNGQGAPAAGTPAGQLATTNNGAPVAPPPSAGSAPGTSPGLQPTTTNNAGTTK